jgi:hypothetical protein
MSEKIVYEHRQIGWLWNVSGFNAVEIKLRSARGDRIGP